MKAVLLRLHHLLSCACSVFVKKIHEKCHIRLTYGKQNVNSPPPKKKNKQTKKTKQKHVVSIHQVNVVWIHAHNSNLKTNENIQTFCLTLKCWFFFFKLPSINKIKIQCHFFAYAFKGIVHFEIDSWYVLSYLKGIQDIGVLVYTVFSILIFLGQTILVCQSWRSMVTPQRAYTEKSKLNMI